MSYSIDKKTIDETLFAFLRSIYVFQSTEQEMFGISWQEVYLMQIIKRNPGKNVTELSDDLRIEKFRASRIIARLEKDEYLRREEDAIDKRVVLMYITTKGLETIEKFEDYHYKLISQQFSNFEEEELRVILNSISRLDELLVDHSTKE